MLTNGYATVVRFFSFSFPTPTTHRVTLSECARGSPVCATVYSVSSMAYPVHHLHYNPTHVSPYPVPFSAAVIIGKGGQRQGQTQNGLTVKNGNATGDQTKCTNGVRTASKDHGNEW